MKQLHFIGIGGVGMSGLAAMCKEHGIGVSGSDRDAHRPENSRIINALQHMDIKIYPQDGSYIADTVPDALVYSTAIEEDNPDLVAGKGIRRLHRAELLTRIIEKCNFTHSIAVTGSCGKSSVTAYLAEALTNLGVDPCCLNGALSKRFHSESLAGNYRPGKKDYFVFEADESDKSLLRYFPDYAIVLNLGTDHYDRQELVRVFSEFLRQVKKGAVLEREVYEALKSDLPSHLNIRVFDAKARLNSRYAITDYRVENATFLTEFTGKKRLVLPQIGFHTALNALAVYALLDMLKIAPDDKILAALERFDGVWRRNDLAGKTAKGAIVYDDYAHNPEKILSCLKAIREITPGNIYAVFQPHGYKPFGFMRDQLFAYLNKFLTRQDRFILLEPFYAGGTSSFTPNAQDVTIDWKSKSSKPEKFMVFPDRASLAIFLRMVPSQGDVVVIMGARDNSLSDFAKSLTI
ncbi:MAG: Mur ligase domain-containing protein [Victivallales bacterium]|jgi:UDP-N-acetylmuramate--alanine ligase|nr:Mur ligase domain-containing protein [Victivallales bacterium]